VDPRYADAIASIESSGRYDLRGPVTRNGDRAYGKYQVMGNNIGPWSQAALGRAVSPDEFLANPSLQDQVFKHRFGQYVNRHGPEGAARAWFAGEGGMNNPNAKDQLGTSVSSYAQRFNNFLGAGTPDEIAYGASAPVERPSDAAPSLSARFLAPVQNMFSPMQEALAPVRDAMPNDFGNRLQNAGAFLQSINSPAALGLVGKNNATQSEERQNALKLRIAAASANKEDWVPHSTKDGRTILVNKRTGETRTVAGEDGGHPTSPGDIAVDKEFAEKEYVPWVSGGYADVQKNIKQLEHAQSALAQNKGLTGGIMGAAPDWMRMWTEKGREAISVREAVEEVAQRNLRQILGGQFAMQEGEKLIARAFNPKLTDAENARRVGLLINHTRELANAKQEATDYFKARGSLKGFDMKRLRLNHDIFGDRTAPASGGGEIAPGVRSIRQIN
jgi:hypothetical protein